MPASASDCTCFRLRRAARQVSQRYDHALTAAGLTLNQYSILRHARHAPLTLGDLAARLGMDRTTLTRNVRPLLDAGWLHEQRGEDARQRMLALSDAGRARIAEARRHWRQAQRGLEALLGAATLARLHADLDALDAALAVEADA